MTDELVSIIIPTHFRNEGLRGALRSVRKQDYSPIEVVVVDDSGEGHARDVVEEFDDVLYIRLPDNRGAQAARNAGLGLATGEFVWFFDDDDQLRPTALTKQVAALREHPNAGMTVCGIQYESGSIHLPPSNAEDTVLERALGFWNSIWRYSAFLVRRTALDAIGPLNEEFEGAGDLWMCIELAQITDFTAVREPLIVVGEGGDHLGMSWVSLESQRKALQQYRDLYAEVDPAVRRRALSVTNRQEALLYLMEHRWSPQAVLAFVRAAYYAPTNRAQHVAELAASMFGRSGYEYIRRFRNTVIGRVSG